MATNYLLGYGQRLMTPIPPPKSDPSKWHPHTLESAKKHLVPRLALVVKESNALPEEFCPHGEAVIVLSLHPAYLAKSHFPSRLLSECRLRNVGSRGTLRIPAVQHPKRKGSKELSLELLVAGSSALIATLHNTIERCEADAPLAGDIIKIDDVRLEDPQSKIRLAGYQDETCNYWEIVLHATPTQDFIVDAFRSIVADAGGVVDVDRRIYAGGLCFVPAHIEFQPLQAITRFQHLRVARGMPRMRTVKRQVGSLLTFNCELPKSLAVNQDIKAVIFDGGPVEVNGLDKWVSNSAPPEIGQAVDDYRDHAIGVASAALFGPIAKGKPLGRPYCNVEVVRVLDEHTSGESPDYFNVLNRVVDGIKARQPDFVNLSIGPDVEVHDDEPHLWTSVLDKLFYDQPVLAFTAVGNNGERDWGWDAKLARVQAPADLMNAFAVGSCNTLATHWQRSRHSSIGPGRSPGMIRPEALAFGGEYDNPFFVLGPAAGTAVPVIGTSYATPVAMRVAAGIRACLGPIMGPLAIKALMINRADPKGERDIREVGWGRICHNVEELVSSDDQTAHIVYQDDLSPSQWMRIPIPLPNESLPGKVFVSATFCYKSPTDPEHPSNYTRAGLRLVFRPHADRFGSEEQKKPNTKSIASMRRIVGQSEAEWRSKSLEWETAIHLSYAPSGRDLKEPAFEIHYNARSGGDNDRHAEKIPFALVVTVRSQRVKDLYNRIASKYRSILEAIRPVYLPVPLQASDDRLRQAERK
jgi:hypothetical protein